MPYDKITSLTNSKVKRVVQLRNRKQRTEDGLTIVEGAREVARAFEAKVVFKELYVCHPLLKGAKDALALAGNISFKKIPVYETTEAVFSKISYGDRGEGLLAVCEASLFTVKDLAPRGHPLFVIVEGVEKPGNLGAILRTCDGAGVDGVIICDGKTDIYNPNVIRASLGTIFSVKTAVSSNAETLEFLRSNSVKICATLPEAKDVYTKANLTGALALVVGSEQEGLTGFWADHADLKVNIPMRGFADSLNVSVSAAIVLYEAIRQRTK
ncbi:MAG: RNA methyltransferase [Candidatus Omnitrophica bacterium]|nr:RNA methyltransferase [Candidatus Omnitrophota bacterium]